jgi:hypothetical protein
LKSLHLQNGEVFQQPETGTTMHLWQVESNMSLPVIVETDELCLYFFIIEERKLILPYGIPLVDTRISIQMIIFAQVILIQDLEHHFTTFTTKDFLCKVYFIVTAFLTAMITLYAGSGFFCRRHQAEIAAKISANSKQRHDRIQSFT